MKTSKVARREAKQLFRACFSNGTLDEGKVRATVQRVIESRPRGFMAILSHFQRLVKLDLERRSARIESAIELSPELRSRIQAGLQQRYGPGLIFSFATKPSLLGGVRIRVGSDVFDGSVQAKLERLQAAL